MHYAIITAIFVLSAYWTIRRGPGGTFAFIFIPVLLLLGVVRPVVLPTLPDVTSIMAVSYGTVVGMIIGGRFPRIRPHLVDAIVVLMSFFVVITGILNGEFWTLVSATGNETLKWIIPYYMARVAFRDVALRRHLALTLCWVAMALASMGAIEFRLWPLFFSRLIASMGLSTAHNEMVQGRWRFFRAMVTCEHPIDFGNVGLLLAGIVPALCVASGLRLRDWRVIGGTIAGAMIVGESISFSSIIGFGVALMIFLALRYVRKSEYLLVPGVIAVAIGGFLFTANLLTIDLESIKPANVEEQLAGSYYVRVLIVQNSWNRFGQQAGLLGFGDDTISKQDLGLESVDNSYMLFLMRRGWIHLSLRLLLALVIASLGTAMLRKARGVARVPPAALVAVLLGTMASMYTVWFGFVYAVLWTLALGMMVTMRQIIGGTVKQEVPATLPAAPVYGRGFDVLPNRGVPHPARMA
jgi:hypothetical protein